MLPRQLIVDELRAKPGDLVMIDVRGNSMEPLFFHGDQILVDKRDRNPVQPGPFALWDGDGYVIKNVERQRGSYRIFSSNSLYSDLIVEPDTIEIMGRPVWYARRL
jgi:phage repressor protein C with HTH and peptisase S24 domain